MTRRKAISHLCLFALALQLLLVAHHALFHSPRSYAAIQPDPDILLQQDFQAGNLGDQLITTYGDWQFPDDPEAGGNKVINGNFNWTNGYGELRTAATTFADYTLTFRARYATSFGQYPSNDGVHFPTWSLHLNSVKDAGTGAIVDGLSLETGYIWNTMLLSRNGSNGGVVGGSPLIAQKDRWNEYKIIKHGNRFQVLINNTVSLDQTVVGLQGGQIWFSAFNLSLFLDDISITAHPEAYVYDTFHAGLSTNNWSNSSGWNAVTETGGNQALYIDARNTTSTMLQSVTSDYTGYQLQFKARQISNGSGNWSVGIHGASPGNWYGLRYIAGSTYGLGLYNGNWTPEGTQVTSNLPADDTWNQYVVIADRNRYQVYVNGSKTIDMQSNVTDPSSGFVGFQVHNEQLWLDDILITPLYAPIYDFTDLQLGSIYVASEQKGLRLNMQNTDFAPHDIIVDYHLTNSANQTVDSQTFMRTLNPGDTITDQALNLTTTAPDTYTIHVTVTADGGRPVGTYSRTMLVMENLPAFSPLYDSKFGWNAGVETLPQATASQLGSLLQKAGLTSNRSGPATSRVNNNGGTWDFSGAERNLTNLQQYGLNVIDLYMTANQGLTTLQGIQEYTARLAASAQHFQGRIPNYEIWNEPNHGGFWRNYPNRAADYTALLKEAFNTVKTSDPAANVFAASLSGVDTTYLTQMMQSGAYQYMDTVSYHPYGYPAVPESIIPNAVTSIKAVVDEYGGWIDHHMTEQGYSSANSGAGVSEDQQAKRLLRTELLGNIFDVLKGITLYNLSDSGPDNSYDEHRFGSLRQDYSAKPAYIALSTMGREIANTDFYGALPYGDDTYVHVYQRYDGTPVIIAWSLANETVSIPVGASSVAITDTYGNDSTHSTSNGNLSIQLSDGPIYIKSNAISPTLLLTANNHFREEKANTLTTEIQTISDSGLRDQLSTAFTTIDTSIEGILTGANALTRSADLEAQITNLYNVANTIVGGYSSSKLSAPQATLLLEGIYYYANTTGKSLITMKQTGGANPSNTDAQTALANANTTITNKIGANGSLIVPQRIIEKAQTYYDKAALAQGTYNAIADVYYQLAKLNATMAQALAQADSVFYRKTLFNVLPKYMTVVGGQSATITTTLSNGHDTTFNGEVKLQYPSNWNQPDITSSQNIATGTQWVNTSNISVPANLNPGLYEITAVASKDGQQIATIPIILQAVLPAKVSLTPLSSSLAQTTLLQATLQITGPQQTQGTISLYDPAGNLLSTADNAFNLPSNGTKQFAFNLNYDQVTPYNEYKVRAVVKDQNDVTLIDQSLPLDFTLTNIVSTAPTVDGNLSDWTGAYPVHLQNFTNPSALTAGDLSEASVYTMADANTFYYALSVKDNVNHQTTGGSGMWQQDSLQVSFDPLNSKNTSYDTTNLELGFTQLSSNGNASAWEWHGPNAGDITSQINLKSTRDEDNKRTVYEIAVPKTLIPNLSATPGSEYGINFCFNDADGGSRINSAQFTNGTCDSKNPSLYHTFTMQSQPGLPSPWQAQDIGSVGSAGSASYNNGTFTVKGSGDDIWNQSDSFQYVYQPLTGDGTITARVVSLTNTDVWAKAGVMIRESLQPGSAFADVIVTPGAHNGVDFQWRASTNGGCDLIGAGGDEPYWVRLTRSGNTFTAASSPDGQTWTQIGTQTIPMGTTVYIGLAVTSHNNSTLNTSVFDNVNVTTP